MTILTLIYTADSAGNFIDPATGKHWDIPKDREFFRDTIAGQHIICGNAFWNNDYQRFLGAKICAVFLREPKEVLHGDEIVSGRAPIGAVSQNFLKRCSTIAECLEASSGGYYDDARPDEIFCVGGKQMIELFSPFASRIIVSNISSKDTPPWLPSRAQKENALSRPKFWTLDGTDIAGDIFIYFYRRRFSIEF